MLFVAQSGPSGRMGVAGVGAQMLVTVYEDDADSQRLEEVTLALRSELLELEVEDVRQIREGEAPSGTRGLDPATVGALMVAINGSVPVVGGVVAAVRRWLAGGSGSRTVELTVGEKTIRLDSATQEQQQALVDDFLRATSRM